MTRTTQIIRKSVVIVMLFAGLFVLGGMAFAPRTTASPNEAPAPRNDVAQVVERKKATATPTATPTPTPSPVPTMTPVPAPPRIGIQVGHWKSNELPDELAKFRTSTGAHAAGYAEADVNYQIAVRAVALLQQQGFTVDLLPATVPPSYQADAFVAIHADGASSIASRGFKVATPWRTSRASQLLSDVMVAEYDAVTHLSRDYAITMNMRGYYAFNNRRRVHAVAPTTPAIIIETGFLTNPSDRAMLTKQPDLVAKGIANGVMRYLNKRDLSDPTALQPPDFKVQRPISPDGVTIRSAPRDNAPIVGRAPADAQLVPFQAQEGWYNVFVRGNAARLMGWVRMDQVAPTNDPTPTPPPASDS
ncbi:MAG TPA: N-acetylmuramoyl-L-alanine amidase [Roseiflexaceae bacterium]|nr:N-acetylmuramoyl-L-alanine amidase [Roseiflexaceae bacterium]